MVQADPRVGKVYGLFGQSLAKHHPCLALGGQPIEPACGVLQQGDLMTFNDTCIGKEEEQAEALEKMGFFAKPDWEDQVQEEWASVPPLVQEFWWPLAEHTPYQTVGWDVDMFTDDMHEEENGSDVVVQE